jgi:hypothetical protein
MSTTLAEELFKNRHNRNRHKAATKRSDMNFFCTPNGKGNEALFGKKR